MPGPISHIDQTWINERAMKLYAVCRHDPKARKWKALPKADRQPYIEISVSMHQDPEFWARLMGLDPDPAVRGHMFEVRTEANRPADQRDRGTPEFRAKKARFNKTDVLLKLVRDDKGRGSLTPAQFGAGQEIRSIFEIITRKLSPSAVDPEQEPVDTSRGSYIPALAEIPEHMEEKYHKNYLPWARAAEKIRVPHTPFNLFEFTVKMVVNNVGPRQLEDMYNLRRGRTASKHLSKSLGMYVDMSNEAEDS